MSTNKTEHLNLHSWVGNDPFRMNEFNENFAAIDAAVNTKAERSALSTLQQTVGSLQNSAAQMVYGSYTGNGSGSQTISLGFAPRAVYVCRQDGSTHYNSNGFNFYCGGLALAGIPLKADGSTVLATIASGFRAYQNTSSTATLIEANQNGVVYHYIAFK